MSEEVKPNEEKQELVIVAEDSDPNRQILCLLLRKLGYTVIECRDGAQAYQALQEQLENNVVAIISDLMMPNMDGLEFLRRTRNDPKTAAMKFVLVTAVSDKDYVFEARNLKVDGYILKPVTYKRVAEKMQALFPERKFPQIAS